MKRIRVFDVLIVYSSSSAGSAKDAKIGDNPFTKSVSQQLYAEPYAYLLKQCQKSNLKAAFTTLNDIVGPGLTSSYWTYDSLGWKSHRSIAKAQIIFDKCSPRTSIQISQRKLLFGSSKIIPFNESGLYDLFFDKLALHDLLYSVTIPSVEVKMGDRESGETAAARLEIIKSVHDNRVDFGQGYVLKDRFGSGGNSIYQIPANNPALITEIVSKNPKTQFILQPMLLFTKGFRYKNLKKRTEIRLIFMKDKLIQVYLRIAAPNQFLCNGHRGARLVYIPNSRVPTKVRLAAENTIAMLPSHQSLYSLDFVVSDKGNPYLLEGNTGPGLNWDINDRDDIAGAKKIMRAIVAELLERVIKTKTSAGQVKTKIESDLASVLNLRIV